MLAGAGALLVLSALPVLAAHVLLRTATLHRLLNVDPERLSLEWTGARAVAGSFELRGDYHHRRDGPHGAILVRKGDLALGVGLSARGSSLHVIAPSAWFEKQAEPGGLR